MVAMPDVGYYADMLRQYYTRWDDPTDIRVKKILQFSIERDGCPLEWAYHYLKQRPLVFEWFSTDPFPLFKETDREVITFANENIRDALLTKLRSTETEEETMKDELGRVTSLNSERESRDKLAKIAAEIQVCKERLQTLDRYIHGVAFTPSYIPMWFPGYFPRGYALEKLLQTYDAKTWALSALSQCSKIGGMFEEAVMTQNILLIKNCVGSRAVWDVDPNSEIPAGYRTEGDTALLFALKNHLWTSISTLLEVGADPNIVNQMTGETPLMAAIETGNKHIVRFLIHKGVKIDMRNNNGETALMLAVRIHQNYGVQDLLIAGANLDARDNNGKTSLMLASESRNNNAMEILRSATEPSTSLTPKQETVPLLF